MAKKKASTVAEGGVEKAKCLRTDCERPSASRGLCLSCYHSAQRLVKEGRTTWDTLEKAGKVLAVRYRAGTGAVVGYFLDDTSPSSAK